MPRKAPEWTEGRLRAFITSVLRGGMRKFPAKWQALEDACVGSLENPKTGRKAKHYRCAMCGNLFVAKDVEVDHISPCVDPVAGFVSWDEFIKRLYCPKENLQVLDKKCHKEKSASERAVRSKKPSKNSQTTTSSRTSRATSKSTPSKSGKPSAPRRKLT